MNCKSSNFIQFNVSYLQRFSFRLNSIIKWSCVYDDILCLFQRVSIGAIKLILFDHNRPCNVFFFWISLTRTIYFFYSTKKNCTAGRTVSQFWFRKSEFLMILFLFDFHLRRVSSTLIMKIIYPYILL